MAYVALVHLMKLLNEEFIQFPCRVLEVEEEKGRVFLLKAYKIMNKFLKFKCLHDVPYSLVIALRGLSEPLSISISEDLVDAARSPEMQLDSRWARIRIPEVLYELDRLKFFLKKNLQKIDKELSSHISHTLREQRDLSNDFLTVCEEFQKVTWFFYELQNKAELLYHATSSLLQRLDSFDHHTVNYIETAADGAGDAIEDFLSGTDDHWFEKDDFMDSKKIQNLLEHVKKSLVLNRVHAHTSEGSKETIANPDFGKDKCKPGRPMNDEKKPKKDEMKEEKPKGDEKKEEKPKGDEKKKEEPKKDKKNVEKPKKDKKKYDIDAIKKAVKCCYVESIRRPMKDEKKKEKPWGDEKKKEPKKHRTDAEIMDGDSSKNIQNLLEHVNESLVLNRVHAHTSEGSKEAIANSDFGKDKCKPGRPMNDEKKPKKDEKKEEKPKGDEMKKEEPRCERKEKKPPKCDGKVKHYSVDYFGVDRDDISNVIDELTKPLLGLTTVRIFQSGDASKSTLAGNVYRYATAALKFDFCAQVSGKSSIDGLLSQILHCIAQLGDGSIGRGVEDKGKLLYESLKGKKYFIILDGLPNFEVWDGIHRYFPDDKVGSRVLLSSFLYPERSWKSLVQHEGTVVGLDEDMNKIIDELTRPPARLLVVTIGGMGGIGKTTLAEKVFHHPTVTHHFHCLAWAKTISDIDQELSHLLHSVAPSFEKVQGLSIEDKGEMLYQSLKGRKFLVVADGLWNFEVWDAIQGYLPDDENGSRILITSRIMDFPFSRNIPTNPPHFVAPLDRHQSWELLEKLVFGLKSCPVELVMVGKQIAEGCGGIPLVIVVIAGILPSIPQTFISWWSIMRDINSTVSVNSEPCLDILAVSYNYLPHHLKACFLYMGAFPENCEVGVKYLLNLWIANGFLNFESLNHVESEANRYLRDLIGRNLISVGKKRLDGKVRTCFIPALVRQLCLTEAKKENFMHVLETGASSQFLEKHHHLVFNLDNLDDFELLPPLPHLRSFKWLNVGSGFTPGIMLLQLSVFKWLRVLDIYLVPFDTFPSQLLKLVNLRYLALNATYELDAQISQFLKLEILVVYGPWVSGEGDADPSLPLEFWKMPWLRGVYVKVTSFIRYPYPLGPILDDSLVPSKLQSFSTVTFSSCTREVLLLMPNLKKLGVSETKKDFEDGELTKCFSNLSFLTKLQTLKCSFYKGIRESRSLGWAFLPVNLRKLTLIGSYLPWEEMKFVALLPKLETLKLKRAFQGLEWVVDEEVFGSLKQLLIENTDLVNWEVESKDHFPCLKRLVLRSCKLLEKIPEGVAELSVLEVIELHHCSESAKSSAQEYEEQYGFPKVVCRG